MSKNLTRKSVALGAIVALGTTLFAGTPAHAADPAISLGSAYGTGLKTVLGSTFDLSSVLTNYGSVDPDLTYFVTGASSAELVDLGSWSTSDHNNTSTGASVAETSTSSPNPVGVSLKVTTEESTEYNDLRIGLATSVDSTRSITVVAFEDSLANGIIDASEVKSAPVTITFVKPTELSATTTLEAPTVGATDLTAYLSVSDINMQQVTGDVLRLQLNKNGASSVAASSSTKAAWSKDDAKLAFKFTSLDAAASTDVYSAQAYVLTAGETRGTGAYAKLGAASGLGQATAPTYEVNVAAIEGATTSNVNDTTDKLRAKTLSIAFKSEITVVPADAPEKAAPAGIPAKVVIAESGSSLGDDVLTVGGKTLAHGGDAITIATTTDAAGYVNFTVNAAKALDSEAFTATVYVLDKTSGYVAGSSATTYTYQTAAIAGFATDIVGAGMTNADGTGTNLGVTKGGSASFGVVAYDQFKQPFSSTKGYKAFVTSSNDTSGAAISTSVALTEGKGTVSFTDNSTATGTYRLNIVLKEWNSSASTWDNETTYNAAAKYVTVTVATDTTVKTLTGVNNESSSTPAIDVQTFKSVDGRSGAALNTYSTRESIVGKAIGADGAALVGVAVKIAGNSNTQFIASGSVHRIGEITVLTDGSGEYKVDYVSHAAGKTAFTVTAGSATKAITGSNFAYPTTLAVIASIAKTGDVSILPGRTATYTFTLKDKFGNTVKYNNSSVGALAKVTYVGPGYFTAALPTSFGVDGTITLTLVVGASDLGTGTLTVVSQDTDGSDTDAAKVNDVTAATVITIGATPVVASATSAAIAGSTKKFYVSVSNNTAAKNVVVKVAGKTVATLKGAAAKKTYTVKATKGSKKVTVYVGGKLIATKTVSVK